MRSTVSGTPHFRLAFLLLAAGLLAFLLLAGPSRPVQGAAYRPVQTAECDFSTMEGLRVCRQMMKLPRFAKPDPPANSVISGVRYGWIEDYAYFYQKPEPGARHARTATTGFFYGAVQDEAVDEEGKQWYKVWDYWLPARYYHEVPTGDFAGVEIHHTPRYPFGWILRPTTPSPAPGAPVVAGDREWQRYEFVEVYDAATAANGSLWFRIGPEQWVRHHTVALTTLRQRPDAVGPAEFWVDVDLSQQTFAAYEGERMVYAGLVSSGLPRWETRVGLNQVWERREISPMAGGVVGDDYYRIEQVAHSLYFDGETALHGAYWHDDFGRPKSHGCVNMAPRTAEWVFYWSEKAPNDLWVWVHNSYYSEFVQ